jgi:ferrochelatase
MKSPLAASRDQRATTPMDRIAPKKLAVVLFNLGGPDSPAAVRPFLYNLFNDPAIIGLPTPLRQGVAWLISTLREKSAQANYAVMGGASPLLQQTTAQAGALEATLRARLPADEVQVFIGMRYWAPTVQETARSVAAFEPDDVVLLPLYPQFSTTTTGSSMKAWMKAYKGPGAVHTVCCSFEEPGLIEAHARAILATHAALGQPGPLRLLFSAHGLPQKVIADGDPYQWQVEKTCEAVLARLGPDWAADWDYRVCYQSRVGPMQWIGPATPDAIREAAADGRGVLITPIAFVSEHVETLVELDHEYAGLARDVGVPFYLRAPAIGVDLAYIEGLAETALSAVGRSGVCPQDRSCDVFGQCPHRIDVRAKRRRPPPHEDPPMSPLFMSAPS